MPHHNTHSCPRIKVGLAFSNNQLPIRTNHFDCWCVSRGRRVGRGVRDNDGFDGGCFGGGWG